MKKAKIILFVPLILIAGIALSVLVEHLQTGKNTGENVFQQEAPAAQAKGKAKNKKYKQPRKLTFVDAHGEWYEVPVLEDVPQTAYKKGRFVRKEGRVSYEDDNYRSRIGVDVSHHQGEIDWQKVKAAGFDFAFLRLGYRGYGKDGTINLDARFDQNITGARAAGVDVGVYFFSQAINEAEAVEEADFVLSHLRGYKLQLPVVYDPESILDVPARTDSVTGEQFTKNTLTFCAKIKEAGYEPMVYSNMVWEAFMYDLRRLSEIPIWYADYEKKPQTPYAFTFWQYTEKGHVDGISGTVDLNVELIPRQ